MREDGMAVLRSARATTRLLAGGGPRRVSQVLQFARERGVGVLVVEQHIAEVLRYADRVFVMRRGRVELSGEPGELAGKLSEIEDSYLGRSGARGGSQ
jgi:branched-chain amino acid transport system ATP-binding protein